jgi:hypothetical protein
MRKSTMYLLSLGLLLCNVVRAAPFKSHLIQGLADPRGISPIIEQVASCYPCTPEQLGKFELMTPEETEKLLEKGVGYRTISRGEFCTRCSSGSNESPCPIGRYAQDLNDLRVQMRRLHKKNQNKGKEPRDIYYPLFPHQQFGPLLEHTEDTRLEKTGTTYMPLFNHQWRIVNEENELNFCYVRMKLHNSFDILIPYGINYVLTCNLQSGEILGVYRTYPGGGHAAFCEAFPNGSWVTNPSIPTALLNASIPAAIQCWGLPSDGEDVLLSKLNEYIKILHRISSQYIVSL